MIKNSNAEGVSHHLILSMRKLYENLPKVACWLLGAVLLCPIAGCYDNSNGRAANDGENVRAAGTNEDCIVMCTSSEEALKNLIWCTPHLPESKGCEDIECGTIREIEAALDVRRAFRTVTSFSDCNGIYISSHSEAFYLDGCLLVLTWEGDLRGNVFDIRVRAYLPQERESVAPKDLSEVYNSSTRYAKCCDKLFESSDVWLRRENSWQLEVSGGCGPSVYSISEKGLLERPASSR